MPAEIFKRRKNLFSRIIIRYTNRKNLDNQWGKGRRILIPKKDNSKDINEYRPIVLHPAVYKIWTTVLSQRLTHVVNLLTDELQGAYKKKTTHPRHYILHKT